MSILRSGKGGAGQSQGSEPSRTSFGGHSVGFRSIQSGSPRTLLENTQILNYYIYYFIVILVF